MVTQREIAIAAGVSRSAVTRALRDDPQISRAECDRIQRIAEKMGYRPNPMINALMTQLRTGKPAGFQAVLGWVAHGWSEAGWRRNSGTEAVFLAARERAKALGYDVQLFFPQASGQDARAFLRMMDSRGIRGLLLDQTASGAEFDDWDFPRFVAVTVGYRLGSPALHFVANDLFAGTWSLLHQVYSMGFRRPGLAIDTVHSHYTQFRIIGGFQAFQLDKLPAANRLPVWQSGGRVAFSQWLERSKPDVLIVDHEHFFGPGRRRPARLPAMSVETSGGMPGMILREEQIGGAAVDLLTAHLVRNETGVPPAQKGVMLEPGFSGSAG
jgi:DNA-binding LacI/PurR family transcriptional regulator